MTKKEVKIGVIALGLHAQRGHLDHLSKIPQAKIIAVCDPSEKAREKFKSTDNISVFKNEDELLHNPFLDAVIICSPDRFHTSSLRKAVLAGKHVLVEKPVGENMEDLQIIEESLALAKQKGLIITSCHIRRFDPPFVWMHDHRKDFEKRFGPVLEIRFDFFYHKPSKTGLHKGLLIDHINHEIDLVHYLVGYSPFRANKLIDSPTRYSANGVREDGITFSFMGSRTLESYVYGEVLAIRFERGEVSINTETANATVTNFETGSVERLNSGRTNYDQRCLGVNQNFVNAILSKGKNYLTDRDLIINTKMGIELTLKNSFSDNYQK
jgi:predicted dehydrogenase